MKTIIRNFLSVLRRYQVATFLNVVGLSIAFAAFLVIMMQVRYEYNYDRCYPDADRIYSVEMGDKETESQDMEDYNAILPAPFCDDVIRFSPHIVAGAFTNPWIGKMYITVTNGDEKKGFKETIITCRPDITEVFGFSMVEGTRDCLRDPEKVMIPQSMARRLFGGGSVIGRQIHSVESIWTKNIRNFTVGGVYQDFPGNSQLGNDIYIGFDDVATLKEREPSNYKLFVRLDDPKNAQDIMDDFNAHYDFAGMGDWRAKQQMQLVPLTKVYFKDQGSREMTNLLSLIAILIVVIAAINYTNFSTSLMPVRIKSVNTQKVLGSSDRVLRGALLVEAAVVSLFAYLLALGIVYVLVEKKVLFFMEVDLSLIHHWPLVLTGLVIAMLTGVLAGIYPAIRITSFPPALLLKGNFGQSASGRKMRMALISFQYIVSITLIVGACIVQLQNRYMRTYSLGFDKEQILMVDLNKDLYTNHREAYVSRLKDYPGIEGVAFSRQKLGAEDVYSTYEAEYKGEKFPAYFLDVSPEFLSVMGIHLSDGRDFTPSDTVGGKQMVILNKSVQKELGVMLGEQIDIAWFSAPVIGFNEPVKLTSLRLDASITPVFVVRSDAVLPFSCIRLRAGADMHGAVNHIREVVKELDPTYPCEIQFYDTVFNNLYYKEEYIATMISLFSILAIVISIVGVFGLVMFETQYRRKEIGIRKVHGAAVQDILVMFNKVYMRIVFICFIVAVPVAWTVVQRWLENFAYKTPVHWWVFALAFSIVASVTLLTVSIQNWRAANENPVNSIKCE